MAVRTPLFWNGTDIQVGDATTTAAALQEAANLINTFIQLGVVESGGDAKFEMTDSRYIAGEAGTNTGSYLSEADTPDIQILETTVSRIFEQTTGAPAPDAQGSLRAFPVYLNGSGEIQVMSEQDFLDTFIGPALNYAIENDVTRKYFIDTRASVPGAGRISETPVFVDTIADLEAYDPDNLPNEVDQPLIVTEYFLHQWNVQDSIYGDAAAGWKDLMYVDSTGALKIFSSTEFNTLFRQFMHYAAKNVEGFRLSYNINGAGTNQGTGMVDTLLSAVSADGYTEGPSAPGGEYITQELPNGEPVVHNTYYLRLTTY